MEYIEVTISLPSAAAQTAMDIAEMTDIGGIYLEDYSDMMDCELVKAINLVDEELMQKGGIYHSLYSMYAIAQGV